MRETFQSRNSDAVTRRDALRLSAGALLAIGIWPGRLFALPARATGDFTFVAINDLHYREEACGPWFDQVVDQIIASAPDAEFCLLGGDIADNGTAAQLTAIRSRFNKLRVPQYAVVGNHDYLTNTDRGPYETIFPNQINYSFEHRGWQLIGLDSTEGLKAVGASIPAATFEWLDANLPKLDRSKPTILFTHFPLGEGAGARSLNADALLERFLNFNLQAAFCGHFHALTEREFHHAILTTDRCCSRVRKNHDNSPQKGWFVCRAERGKVTHKFVEFHLEDRETRRDSK